VKIGEEPDLYLGVEFEYPTTGGPSDKKVFPMETTFKSFKTFLANELDIAPKKLQLAYQISVEAKSMSHCLSTDENWDWLWSDVQKAYEVERSKRSGQKKKEVWVVVSLVKVKDDSKKNGKGKKVNIVPYIVTVLITSFQGQQPLKKKQKKDHGDSGDVDSNSGSEDEASGKNDPLAEKPGLILQLQKAHTCKTGKHKPGSVGCWHIGGK
jgi:hypothetical protein